MEIEVDFDGGGRALFFGVGDALWFVYAHFRPDWENDLQFLGSPPPLQLERY